MQDATSSQVTAAAFCQLHQRFMASQRRVSWSYLRNNDPGKSFNVIVVGVICGCKWLQYHYWCLSRINFREWIFTENQFYYINTALPRCIVLTPPDRATFSLFVFHYSEFSDHTFVCMFGSRILFHISIFESEGASIWKRCRWRDMASHFFRLSRVYYFPEDLSSVKLAAFPG